MPLSITYNNFLPGTTIYSSQANTNSADIENWANAHEVATTAVHGVGAGTIVGTANINVFTASNTFSSITNLFATQTVQSGQYASNASFTLAAGILSLRGNAGGVPSSTNPVYFRIPSRTVPGRWDTLTFTSATHCSISDSASADSYFYNGVAGCPFGTTSGVLWGSVTPFTVYIATDGTTPVLFLSREPNRNTTPATALIGYKDVPPATNSANNFFAFSATDVTVTHQLVQCYPIGSISMTKSTLNDWAISMNAGPNYFRDYTNRFYTFPVANNGASAGAYTAVTGGGTAPTYTASSSYIYWISQDGTVTIDVNLNNAAGGTAGAGAGDLRLSIPFQPDVIPQIGSSNFVVTNGATANICFAELVNVGGTVMLQFRPASGPGTFLTGADQNNAIRSIRGSVIYKAFANNA